MSATDLILLIHGLGCNARSWEGISTYRNRFDGDLWLPDLPGFGNTTPPAGFDYSLEEQAAWLAATLRNWKWERLHVVAHSMGGAIGLLLPEEILQRTHSFISVEGNLIAEDCSLISRRVAETPLDRFSRDDFPRMQQKWDRLGITGIALAESTAEAFHASCRSLVRWSESGHLKRRFLNLPCYRAYVYGSRNTHLPILQQLPRDLLVRIPDSGHFPMHDNPAVFFPRLARLLYPE